MKLDKVEPSKIKLSKIDINGEKGRLEPNTAYLPA